MAAWAGVIAAILILICVFLVPEDNTPKRRVQGAWAQGLKLLAFRSDKTRLQRVIISLWLALTPSGRLYYRSILATKARAWRIESKIIASRQEGGG